MRALHPSAAKLALLHQMLRYDPRHRVGTAAALAHKYFTEEEPFPTRKCGNGGAVEKRPCSFSFFPADSWCLVVSAQRVCRAGRRDSVPET